ncbi:hypothetical protein BDD12DRAFT_887876 [Trichophaea hybrida]|nr:hypothetical protein BDD12DRAFT_887876 [Trichophaea hybrida]
MPQEQAEILGDSAGMNSRVQSGQTGMGDNSEAQSNEMPPLPGQPNTAMVEELRGVSIQTNLSQGMSELRHRSESLLQIVSGEATGADCLDLCFRPFRKDRYHDWRSLQFSREWDGDALFRELSCQYYGNKKPERTRWRISIHQVLSFRHLELVQPTSFILVPDDYFSIKATCFEYEDTSLQRDQIAQVLASDGFQYGLAARIRSAHRLGRTIIGTQVTVDPLVRLYWTKVMGRLSRPSVPPLEVGAGGKGLEFVEDRNRKKWMLQLLVLTGVQVIVACVIGWREDSVDKAFIVLGGCLALSQLFVSVLVLLVPPVRQ